MAKRRTPPEQKQMVPEPKKEELAADRELEQRTYPTNNFALGAATLAVVIALIIVLYVFGVFNP